MTCLYAYAGFVPSGGSLTAIGLRGREVTLERPVTRPRGGSLPIFPDGRTPRRFNPAGSGSTALASAASKAPTSSLAHSPTAVHAAVGEQRQENR